MSEETCAARIVVIDAKRQGGKVVACMVCDVYVHVMFVCAAQTHIQVQMHIDTCNTHMHTS